MDYFRLHNHGNWEEKRIPLPPSPIHSPTITIRRIGVIISYLFFGLTLLFTIYPIFHDYSAWTSKFTPFNYGQFALQLNDLHSCIGCSAPPHQLNDDPVSDRIGQPTLQPSAQHLHSGAQAMVACDVPLCSSMGKQILQSGGNAADAAITVALCIGSVNSHSSGIGGGGFIVSSQKTTGDAPDDVISIDAREMAPGKAYKSMFDHYPVLAQVGGLAVAIPGELKGLDELYRRHGSGLLSWQQLFEPVIELNQRGWQVSEIWHRSLVKMTSVVFRFAPIMKENWDFIFKSSHDKGQVVDVGDHIRRANYAATLRLIAHNGSSDVFYDPQGPIAPTLVDTATKLGGIIAVEDFARYKVNVDAAVQLPFELGGYNHTMYTAAGNSAGLALAAGLNFYSQLQSEQPIQDVEDKDLIETHRIVESMKWISSARSYLGDVHNDTERAGILQNFTSAAWARDLLLRDKYSDLRTFPWQHYEPRYESNRDHGTAHFSVVDNQGNAVSMTTTVNLLFGSMVYDNATGVILNDEMDDFSLPNTRNAFNLTPSVYNYIDAYKRPLSSMTPTIIKDAQEEIELIIGAAGGSRIPTAVFHAIVRKLYSKLPLLEVISRPRLHHQLIPEYIQVENFTVFGQEHQRWRSDGTVQEHDRTEDTGDKRDKRVDRDTTDIHDRIIEIQRVEAEKSEQDDDLQPSVSNQLDDDNNDMGQFDIRKAMQRQLGHSFEESGALTAMNAIARIDAHEPEARSWGWHGVSDYWRKRGEADGY